ncbi:hypothetical protein RS130_22865 [Paraglaciecola aquimarina]|uniref:Right handed beta helix domain-containing protein n=1 Tax=Paraglaciecola aquimarina TaxID=1235557 RepID=A0ABU3T2B8_9ALTE|nr:hypothetical protein [Paraglaciecola aquimarina]MDU0356352.1 hypothetical protein [Paraglaciecola aquimarina]
MANNVSVDGKVYASLAQARPAIRNGSHVHLFAGIFKEGIYLQQSNITITGEQGVIFDGAVADEKAALVLTGNNVLVEHIECRNIYVPDLNGACIRFEGKNISIKHLYAHDSQSGVMTSSGTGQVNVEHSTFERLGGKAQGEGYAHALYIIAEQLTFQQSKVIATKGEGSGIKSRSKKVIIDNSLLATMEGKDSRLVDMANYGELIIKNSILQQGSHTSNSQLLAYGLEKNVPAKFAVNRIELTDNIIFFDNHQSNVYISYRIADELFNEDNILIGYFNSPLKFIGNNKWYTSRKRAHILPYPFVPSIDNIANTRDSILRNGISEN